MAKGSLQEIEHTEPVNVRRIDGLTEEERRVVAALAIRDTPWYIERATDCIEGISNMLWYLAGSDLEVDVGTLQNALSGVAPVLDHASKLLRRQATTLKEGKGQREKDRNQTEKTGDEC